MAHDDGGAATAEVRVAPAPLGFRDRYLRRTRTTHLIYRVLVGIVGALIVALGVVLLPLPGPGWLVIFAGMAILASEFAWAARLLDFARDRVLAWTHWVGRQSLWIRLLIGLAIGLLVAFVVVGYLSVVGVPTWLPDGLQGWLESWVP